MKVTLQLSDGRIVSFSEVIKIIDISEEIQPSMEYEVRGRKKEIATTPTEGKWFKVNPLAIDLKLFEEERKDAKQEEMRLLILEAFEQLKKSHQYGKSFKTLIPQKKWLAKNVSELKALARKFGDRNTDWVEQAFEFAQRIANGETWEDVCNNSDTLEWHRMVSWKDSKIAIVGGSIIEDDFASASNVEVHAFNSSYLLRSAVPSVVEYDE